MSDKTFEAYLRLLKKANDLEKEINNFCNNFENNSRAANLNSNQIVLLSQEHLTFA